jgi:glycosyltransferase involved in cell wall biosynthesis
MVVLAPAHASAPAVQHDGRVEIRRVLRRGPLPQTLADPVATLRAARALRDRPFDLLLAHQTTGACGLLAARLEAPLALVFHASVVLELRFLRRRVGELRRASLLALDPVLSGLEHIATRRAAAILVLSEFSAELLRSRHPDVAGRIRVVGGGLDDGFFEAPGDANACRDRFGIPRDALLLLTARRLEPRMGVDVLLEALSLLDDDRLMLAVAGTGSAREALERQVRRLGLGERVRLLGRVSDDDLRALYAAADLFVLPTVAYEGFGMSTVEALAAGTPALGTAVGATPEILAQLGPEFVVPGSDPQALVHGLRQVLPRLGPDLRRAARSLAERYRWDDVIVRWERELLAVTR